MKISGFIFDLDGTLVDSLPGIAQALNASLTSFELPNHHETEVRKMIGDGAATLIKRALPEAQQDHEEKVLAEFNRYYLAHWQDGTHLYPGVLDLLTELSSQQVPLAVLSNKNHASTVEIVETLFPSGLFNPIWGFRPEYPKKPDPTTACMIAEQWNLPPQQIAYVGDSLVDLTTARNAEMTPLIFDWGYGTPDHAPLFSSVNELRVHLASYSN